RHVRGPRIPGGAPLHRNPRRTRRWRIFARDIGHFAQGEVPFTRVRSPGNGGDTGGCESGRTEVMTVTVPHLRAAHPDADAELMAAVIEQAPTPLWVIAGGRVELVNRAAVSLLGYSTAADLVGQASHCALHERRPDGSAYPQEACPIVASAAAARPAHGREWFTTSAGVPLPVTWTTRRLG